MAKVVVGKTSDIPEGKLTHVTAGGKEVLVANVGGSYYAIGDICNHGNLLWFPAKLNPEESFKVSIENGTVYLEV